MYVPIFILYLSIYVQPCTYLYIYPHRLIIYPSARVKHQIININTNTNTSTNIPISTTLTTSNSNINTNMNANTHVTSPGFYKITYYIHGRK